MTEQQLLLVILEVCPGDAGVAWAELDRCYRPQALKVAAKVLRRYGVSAHLAEDAVQHAFVKFFTCLHRLRQDLPPVHYFLTIVRHAAIDLVRREARQTSILRKGRPVATGPAADHAVLLGDGVRELLGLLAPEDQELMAAHYVRGLSVLEIAAEHGWEVRYVYRRLHTCRTQLRAHHSRRGRSPRNAA